MRKPLFLFLCLFFSLTAPLTALATVPKELSGAWKNVEKNEAGQLTVFVANQNKNELRGTIIVTGTTSCKNPISFLGKVSGRRILIESDEKNVCGKDGKFSVEATREQEAFYVGTFSYVWMGGVWASGTFQLSANGQLNN
ncbi:MAG: hypothetical protein A3D65_04295 [Candidatus Lloydbacteria bacterium RIFCSPHIGHO2_02_FULL_50_13]|uniref:DUF2147 domain-containing protein n=1 Tax=Candidatus Lloydbacteria bacterium RIFCSPHIGHO2_02_FULL_50_13 TaxID=1798661 RepID=A0A1G2D2G2_9BACT|nr:MAG: hypothetical protein A3D65_04295 [Candidatus Lloydbacteria bacterium RIFCSPHIGHO2_02_FULL_50_13]